jgi:hypothetical protein
MRGVGPRKSLRSWIVVAGIVAAMMVPTAAFAAGTGSISGNVTAAHNGWGINGIQAVLYRRVGSGAGAVWNWQTQTTANFGSYSFSALDPGTYTVKFNDETGYYVDRYAGGAITESGALSVEVTSTAVGGVNVALPIGGRIHGSISFEATPVLATVKAYRWLVGSDYGYWDCVYADTRASGFIDLYHLETDNYLVEISDPSYTYATVYYSSQSEADHGQLVPVTLSVLTDGINQRMPLAGSITGRVTDHDGLPISGAAAAAYRWTLDGGGYWQAIPNQSFYTAADGTYLIKGLNSGSYKVQFSDPSGNHATRCYGGALTKDAGTAVMVTVGQRRTGVNISLPDAIPGTPTALTVVAPAFTYSGSASLYGTLTPVLAGASVPGEVSATGVGGGEIIDFWQGLSLLIERSVDGGRTWPDVATVVTGPRGVWSYTYNPSSTYERSQKIRVTYAGLAGWYWPSTATADLGAKVYLSTPKKSVATPTHGKSFVITGYLKPKFRSGTFPVKAYFYKRNADSTYSFAKSASMKASNYSTYTKLTATTSLPSKGSYRVRFDFSGASRSYKGYAFSRTYSAYADLTVK